MSENVRRICAIAILSITAALSIVGAVVQARDAALGVDARDALRGDATPGP